jgi:HlyD family secretion protein
MLYKADVAEVLAAESRRGTSRRWIRIVLTAIAVVVIAAVAAAGGMAWRNAVTPAYVTDPVTRSDITVTLTASGTIEPTRSIPVSSLVSGTIVSVEVDYNDPVTRGQVLARLDPADLEAAHRRAVASAAVASANSDAAHAGVEDARAALRRAEGLDKNRNISSRDLELAGTNLTRAKANLAATEAQVRAAEADVEATTGNLARARIVSPIDGLVLDMNAEIGLTVSPAALASPLFTIASDLSKLELKVDVDEADVTQLAVGDRATFTAEAAPDRLLFGTVRQIHSGPKIRDGVTTYVAVIAVANSDLLLKPGMTTTADIAIDEARDVLTVPNSALRFLLPGEPPPMGPSRVYVLRDGAPQQVPVVTGLSNGQRTEIVEGSLEPDDLVITALAGR